MRFCPLIMLFLAGCAPQAAPTSVSAAGPIGSQECARCHQAEAAQWSGSHHAKAMQPATAATVLANFNGADKRFFKREGKFWARLDARDYAVQYTFGVYPLQQYLVPTRGGRLQALPWAWDARPKNQGGQRWFELQKETGALTWTGPYQNWNFMCADCHSSGVNKNYDPKSDSYATRSLENGVSCEACHGPGAAHRAWAEQAGADPHKGWSKAPEPWLETCARCHSRRSALNSAPDGLSFHDAYQEETLEAPNYHADGQILEEDFEVGAFRQSKMHARGVTCLDCHQAHSLQLKAQGNDLCLRCHDAARFGGPSHSHHEPGSAGAACISCHMPAHTYMGVHQRHDHSLRVPRPDLSDRYGLPNACNSCHTDKSATWAEQAVTGWFGSKRVGFQHHLAAFHSARRQSAGAESALQALARRPEAPALVRATALAELRRFLSERSLPVVEEGLRDADPGVRVQALRALEALPLEERWKRAESLLGDPRRAVRLRAVAVLGAFPAEQLGPTRVRALQPALQEYLTWAEELADRPEAHLEMGLFYAQRGQGDEAERCYRQAMALEPRLAHTYINLSDLFRARGDETRAEAILRQGLRAAPAEAGLHHALGLTLVRRGQVQTALPELERAVQLEPEELQYAYVLMVAWRESGRRSAALELARRSLTRYPEQAELLSLAQQLALDNGSRHEAAGYAKRLQNNARRQP